MLHLLFPENVYKVYSKTTDECKSGSTTKYGKVGVCEILCSR